jgi:hypothetical protein
MNLVKDVVYSINQYSGFPIGTAFKIRKLKRSSFNIKESLRVPTPTEMQTGSVPVEFEYTVLAGANEIFVTSPVNTVIVLSSVT